MSDKKQKTDIKTSDKKAVVLGEGKKNNILPYIITICVLVVVAAIFFSFTGKKEPQQSDYLKTSNVNQVTHPVDLFVDGAARHFQFDAGNGIQIKYFVLKSSDEVIRAAFDACDVCWPSGKGYYQDGDYMVCRNCGRRFVSNKVNEVKGGCNPTPLNRRVEGNNLIIEINDIIEGSHYFDFSNGRDT